MWGQRVHQVAKRGHITADEQGFSSPNRSSKRWKQRHFVEAAHPLTIATNVLRLSSFMSIRYFRILNSAILHWRRDDPHDNYGLFSTQRVAVDHVPIASRKSQRRSYAHRHNVPRNCERMSAHRHKSANRHLACDGRSSICPRHRRVFGSAGRWYFSWRCCVWQRHRGLAKSLAPELTEPVRRLLGLPLRFSLPETSRSIL
jgi:hypothetical protein